MEVIFRVISSNKYGTECLFTGTYDECFAFCKDMNWEFKDQNKHETILQIF